MLISVETKKDKGIRTRLSTGKIVMTGTSTLSAADIAAAAAAAAAAAESSVGVEGKDVEATDKGSGSGIVLDYSSLFEGCNCWNL